MADAASSERQLKEQRESQLQQSSDFLKEEADKVRHWIERMVGLWIERILCCPALCMLVICFVCSPRFSLLLPAFPASTWAVKAVGNEG
jgi:hypothetical protein